MTTAPENVFIFSFFGSSMPLARHTPFVCDGFMKIMRYQDFRTGALNPGAFRG
jgi:hypothetical protein